MIVLFHEQDEIDWERHFYKIPFHLFEQDGISQKLNLAHACLHWHPILALRQSGVVLSNKCKHPVPLLVEASGTIKHFMATIVALLH